MAGLGLLFGALSGAGRGVAQVGEQGAREQAEKERMRLEEERMLRIDEIKRQRERSAGVQQGQDIGAEASRLQNQRDAEAINAQFGSNMTAADAEALRTNPEARKAYGLLASTRQSDLEDRASAAEKLGYLDAARETRGALQTEIGNQRNKDLDEDSKRRLDLQEKRQTAVDEYNKRRESRLDRLADAQLQFQKARANKEDNRADQMAEREQRAATVAAMKGAEQDVRAIQKELADPLLAEEQKRQLQEQLNAARTDARRFRNALGGAGLEGSQAPDKPFNPADFPIGGKTGRLPAQSSGTANPARGEISEAVERRTTPAPASPQAQAKQAIDAAIRATVGELTAANNRGDQKEVARLNAILQEQQAAKARM